MTTEPKKYTLLEPRSHYKPFVYPWAFEGYKVMQDLHWLPHEAPLAEDVKDWRSKLSETEKALLTQLFRFFTQADCDIAQGYFEKYGIKFKHPELRMMIGVIIAAEANHIDAYASLIETLGLPEVEFQAFQDYAAMRNKHEYMFERGRSGDEIEDLIVDIAVFSAFGEGMQLFSSFAMLMSFQRRGLMKGMTTLIEWSIRDESHHVECMVRLYHELLKENPRYWNDRVKQRIYEACRQMVDLEDAFIDQAFALGPVEGMTPEEAKLYIRYTADRRLLQLGLKRNYNQMENPFDWLDWIMNAPTHTNFFEQRSTEYGKGEINGWPTAYDFMKRPPLLIEGGASAVAKKLAKGYSEYRVYTMPDCPHCVRAKAMLSDNAFFGDNYEFIEILDAAERQRLKAEASPDWKTFPLVYGRNTGADEWHFVGGADQLEKVLP